MIRFDRLSNERNEKKKRRFIYLFNVYIYSINNVTHLEEEML